MELRSGRKKPMVAHQIRQPRHKKVVTILAGRTGMADLPPEVLREIFLWSKCEHTLPGKEGKSVGRVNTLTFLYGCVASTKISKYRSGINWKIDPNTINPNEENPSYKSFRQVCRLWHHIITPLLFENVVLLPHTDSWTHADSICRSPHLAPYVRRLRVDATLRRIRIPTSAPDDEDGLSMRTWLHNRDMPWLRGDLQPRYSRPSFKSNGGPFANLSEDDESVYSRYKRWRKGEIAMNDHHKNGTIPRVHLELLCNVQRVEVVYRNNIAAIKQRFDHPDRNPRARLQSWRVQDNLTRREVETKLYDVSERRDVDLVHLDLFAKALGRSGLEIRFLTLREPEEYQMIPATMPSLQSLRRLELHFEDSGHETFEGELDLRYDGLVQYIGSFSDLEGLSVTMPISPLCDRFMKILNLLPDLTVPKLRSLSLKRVRGSYETFHSFVRKHKNTLRSLSIEEPRISVDDWERFCVEEQPHAWEADGKTLLLTKRYIEEWEKPRKRYPGERWF